MEAWQYFGMGLCVAWTVDSLIGKKWAFAAAYCACLILNLLLR